jgi:hypothetical protein
MIGAGVNGVNIAGRGRFRWSEEYHLAHNLLNNGRDPDLLWGQVSRSNSGD